MKTIKTNSDFGYYHLLSYIHSCYCYALKDRKNAWTFCGHAFGAFQLWMEMFPDALPEDEAIAIWEEQKAKFTALLDEQ